MKQIILFSIIILSSYFALSQQKSQIEVPADRNLREVLSNSLQYVEPDFILGRVVHNDGSVSEAFLNYNILLGEMHFIFMNKETGKDKVLSLANPQDINFISFGKRLFIWDKRYGYLEVLVNGNTKLVKRSKLEIKSGERPRDSYGYLPESASSSNIQYFGGENFIYAPDREEIIKANTFRDDRYYAVKNESVKALTSKKVLFKLVPKSSREELKNYQTSQKGFWNSEDNLIDFFKRVNKIGL